MLERLFIKQFAIIDHMEIDFLTPYTVMTGETGAGKSILIEAVAILLGARSSAEIIRHGADRAYVEGVFRFAGSHPVYSALREGGWADGDDDGEGEVFVLSRELNTNGKNTCRINACTVGLQVYRRFAAGLMDIHGQHDYQQLMQSQKQLDILDAFGGAALSQAREEAKLAFDVWQERESKLAQARENQQAFASKKDFLAFQLKEIDDAKLSLGEDQLLETEISKLTHSQRISLHLDEAYALLFRPEHGESAYDLLSKALQQLRGLGKYDGALEGLYSQLEPALYLIDEAAMEIGRYRDQLDAFPGRLEEAENRLYRIRALGKKYGEGVEAILKFRQSAAAELADMDEFALKEEEWEAGVEKAKLLYDRCAASLTSLRLDATSRLEEQINLEFHDLAMKAARFKVDIREGSPGRKGKDEVEFLISTNTGEPLLPLAKIASGGELARITLAMKRILASSDTCETMVFDEIDSGIGGTTAQAVSDKLLSISGSQQVICVTHSPIIAAKAKQHLLFEKLEEEGRTRTTVCALDSQSRVKELMRMLGGDSDSEDLRRHASAMLADS